MRVKSFGVALPLNVPKTLVSERIDQWERKQMDKRMNVRHCKRPMFNDNDAKRIMRKFGVRL